MSLGPLRPPPHPGHAACSRCDAPVVLGDRVLIYASDHERGLTRDLPIVGLCRSCADDVLNFVVIAPEPAPPATEDLQR